MNKDKSIRNIIRMQAISSGFAATLVAIFIPIYILQLGHSIAEVMVFLIIHNAVLFLAAFAAVFSSNKFGLVATLRIRFVFLFVYLLLLYLLQTHANIPIYLAAIIGGVEAAFYWIPVNIFFTRYSKLKEMAKQLANFFVLPEAAGVISPAIGGIIVALLGFPALFVAAFFVNIAALWLLHGLEKEKTDFKFSFTRFKEIWQRNRTYFVSEFFDNINEEVVGIIFPIVVYLNLLSITDVGLVGTFLSAGMMAFTFLVGGLADKYDKRKMIRLGALLLIAVWPFAFYMESAVGFYIISVIIGFFLRLFLVPYGALLFANAKIDDAQFIVLRELPVILGRIFVFLCAIVLASRLEFVFFAAMLSLFYFFFFNPRGAR